MVFTYVYRPRPWTLTKWPMREAGWWFGRQDRQHRLHTKQKPQARTQLGDVCKQGERKSGGRQHEINGVVAGESASMHACTEIAFLKASMSSDRYRGVMRTHTPFICM